MDKQKVAKELLAVAKELTAATGVLKYMTIKPGVISLYWGAVFQNGDNIRQLSNSGMSVDKEFYRDVKAYWSNFRLKPDMEVSPFFTTSGKAPRGLNYYGYAFIQYHDDEVVNTPLEDIIDFLKSLGFRVIRG